MTRKDFELLAAAVREARDEIRNKEPKECHADLLDGAAYVADFLADTLARQNSRFDRERFIRACGIEAGRIETLNAR